MPTVAVLAYASSPIVHIYISMLLAHCFFYRLQLEYIFFQLNKFRFVEGGSSLLLAAVPTVLQFIDSL